MPTIIVIQSGEEWIVVMVSGTMDQEWRKCASIVDAKAAAFDIASQLLGPVLVRIVE